MINYRHRIGEYITILKKNGLYVDSSVPDESSEIEQVTCDTRELRSCALFFCKGAHFKEEYLQNAIQNGAAAYISEKKYDVNGAPYIIVSDIRRAMAVLGSFHYDNASSKLKMIGITGTKGKTTAAYFIKYILDAFLTSTGEKKSAIISSVDTYDGVIKKESHMTTPEPLDVQMHCGNAYASGISYLTMEVTSQALKYGRVYGINYDVGVFLNIGYDHISSVEHTDMEDYFKSKLKLFDQCRTACVNLDSDRADEVLDYAKARCAEVFTFGTKPEADIYAYNIRKDGADIAFDVKAPGFEKEFRISIPGLFNVENALSAIAVCVSLGIPQKYIYMGLMRARSSGRMEVYSSADEKVVCIVDYAHNKMSFEALLQSVRREFPGRHITIVFGCPGCKAFNRREDLGRAAGKYADHAIITEEDYGEEPFMQISSQIAEFVKAEDGSCTIEEDRGKAIRDAIFGEDQSRVILITGKGDETRQKRGTEYIDCLSDVEYTKKYLSEYDENIDTEKLYPKLSEFSGQTFVISGMITDDVKQNISVLNKYGIKTAVPESSESPFDAAKRLRADRLVILSESEGILIDPDNPKTLVRSLSLQMAKEFVTEGFAEGALKDLLERCIDLLGCGVGKIALLDSRKRNNLLLHLLLPVVGGTVISGETQS